MQHRRKVLATLFCLVFVSAAWAAPVPTAAPEEVGLSSQRLNRIDKLLGTDIEQGRIPGAVALVARRGKVAYFQSFGMRDKEAGAPMENDSIFRIYSMTKPFVSVAAMMLAEEGKLYLTEKVSKYLPEFSEMKVGVIETDGATGQETVTTVPVKRAMTIQDLLRHTAGLTYGVFGKSAIKTMYLDAGVNKWDQTIGEMVEKLGKIPLVTEPGTFWEYSRATDVLGRLLEVVSGMPLDQLLAERVFHPLGMKDTGFYVKSWNLGRVAQPAKDPKTGKAAKVIDVTIAPTFISGGGGSVSTVGDYFRFCQMLLNGGELGDVRLLGPKTVGYMTSDHVGPLANRSDGWYLPGPGYGFGLGFGVRLEAGRSGWPGTTGDFFWGGWAGTYFWVDPQEELIAILMFQEPAQRLHYRMLFRNLVYQAIVD